LDRKAFPDADPLFPPTFPFYRPEPAATFDQLPSLRPSALYIFGSESPMSSPALQKDKLENTGTGIGGSGGTAAGRVEGISLDGIGHLVAMDATGQCAEASAKWIGKELALWSKEHEEFVEWTKKSLREKQMVSEEWKTKIGGPFTKPVKGKI